MNAVGRAFVVAACAVLLITPGAGGFAQSGCEPDPGTGRRCPVGQDSRPACDEECRENNRIALRSWREAERQRRQDEAQRRRDERARQAQARVDAREARERAQADRRLQALLDRGESATRAGRYNEARARFREALRMRPMEAMAQSGLMYVDRYEAYSLNEEGLRLLARRDYEGARNAFTRAVALYDLDPEIGRNLERAEDALRWRPSGNGMILGTGAQERWAIPPGYSREQRERLYAALTAQYRAANREIPPELSRFDFVIGVAYSSNRLADLLARVSRDQFTAIPVPEDERLGYSALRGRRFETLSCHSAGAMLCLLALVNDDVRATDVVLYGPQVTPSALQVWQRQLSSGRIRSLRIVVADEDPIPPAAMMANADSALWLSRENMLRFVDLETLRSDIARQAPGAVVQTRSCHTTARNIFGCHDVAGYVRDDHGR